MGRVYLGRDRHTDLEVAIKLLRARLVGSFAEQRLLREAQALARIGHPNVVEVHEFGRERGAVYIAMDLVDGPRSSVWARARADWRERLAMLVQAGRGLAATHAAGFIHRDFKPDNVLVDRDGRARVVDFGLVRTILIEREGDEQSFEPIEDLPWESTLTSGVAGTHDAVSSQANLDTGLTAHGSLIGTPTYMAPEQHGGRRCNALADQFCFCVSAFELLFETLPYPAKQLPALARAKLDGDIAAIPTNSPIPRRVRDAILRGLAPTPAARWPSMDTLLDQLDCRSWR